MSGRRPYVDRPVTDLVAAERAATEAARAWGLPAPTLMRRGMNALFAADSVVIRVGNATAPARLAHELVSSLLEHGIPTLHPVPGLVGSFEDRTVSGWERLEPADAPIAWEQVGRSVRAVHELPVSVVPPGYPTPDPTWFPWWDFDQMLAELGPVIDERALAGLARCVATNVPLLEGVRSATVLCHGDVHPGNVVVTGAGPLLIDWDLLCIANPAWDHAMLITYAERWGGPPGTYEAFARGYGRSFVDDPLTLALAELRNVAATLMRVRAGSAEPTARHEAERRLRYWRGDPDAPIWRAQ